MHTIYYTCKYGDVCQNRLFKTAHCVSQDPNLSRPLVESDDVIVAAMFKSPHEQEVFEAIPTVSLLADPLRGTVSPQNPLYGTQLASALAAQKAPATAFEVADACANRSKSMRFEIK